MLRETRWGRVAGGLCLEYDRRISEIRSGAGAEVHGIVSEAARNAVRTRSGGTSFTPWPANFWNSKRSRSRGSWNGIGSCAKRGEETGRAACRETMKSAVLDVTSKKEKREDPKPAPKNKNKGTKKKAPSDNLSKKSLYI